MEVLSVKQAYIAMYIYLDALYRKTNSEDLGSLLGGMAILVDGGTADPAAWDDWLDAVEASIGHKMPEVPIMITEACIAMHSYLYSMQKLINSEELAHFTSGMNILNNGNTANPDIWENWLKAVELSKDENNWNVANFQLSN